MQQPIEILADDTADAGSTPHVPRRLRVVTADEPAQRLVTYVVLAPTHLAPEDLFSPGVVVHPSTAGSASALDDGRTARLVTVGERPGGRRGERPIEQPARNAGERPGGQAAQDVGDQPDPVSGISVDTERRTAQVDGRPLDLTYLEFEVLAHFVAHPHLVHSRTSLLELIWGYHYAGDGRTVDVHIARLRRKLGPAHRTSIHTVRRAGYKYVPLRSSSGG